MSIIHWYKPAHDDSRLETRCSIHEGEVGDIARRMMQRIRSQGHEVNEAGGDWTGDDGRPRAIWFDVIVYLHDDEPDDPGMKWEHAVVTPGELWTLASPTTSTTDGARG